MNTQVAIALVLAAASATLVNLAYLREHDAAAELPALSMRRPLHSIGLLVGDRSWMLGFGMESLGFVLYAVALAFASLALVQSISAGGIGVLAFVSARMARRPLSRNNKAMVIAAVLVMNFSFLVAECTKFCRPVNGITGRIEWERDRRQNLLKSRLMIPKSIPLSLKCGTLERRKGLYPFR